MRVGVDRVAAFQEVRNAGFRITGKGVRKNEFSR